ncbi:hypothetical protein [Nocardia jiangsuensis]|uniref:Phosphopantetheine binding protein n=1 Tax=Nocardia jiangsuensis TaxID=1691563 RepID=A0ABV8DZ79_9NOCA
MTILDEAEFIDATAEYLAALRGPEHGPVNADENLVTDSGLESLQLVALLRFIETLRGDELLEFPELGDLTLRTAYRSLYVGIPAPI